MHINMQDLTLTVDDEELARPNLEDLRRLSVKRPTQK
jgi:hypothetical protein